MTFKDFVSEFLGLLERQESKLLSWGFYNGTFDSQQAEVWLSQASDELRDAWAELESNGECVASLLEQLSEKRLLHEVPGTPGRFRSRFAEGVRLLAGLRQLFPHRAWSVAPRLVSDIRIDLAPRSYPKRGVTAEECWRVIAPSCPPARQDLLRECFFAMAAKSQSEMLTFAGFQLRAFSHIFTAYGGTIPGGSVVSAGTGSGKTKAFYVPAFLRIVEEIAQRRPSFTKLVAIYPRNVLLADQLREALSEAAKFRPVLDRRGLRPITFGALLGDTPNDDDFDRRVGDTGKVRVETRHWRPSGTGFTVPFLKSPSNPKNDLVWRDSDRSRGQTCLYDTSTASQPEIPDQVLRLTRQQLQKEPPDVLFLSAEMLNREMGNTDWSRTLGIGRGALTPRLVLLDEIHTYQGIQGAQISWLLRRWRHWSKARTVHFVGLSATLRDAPTHLARVVGIPPGTIGEFRPEASELDFEGIEYNLAVKGNPAGASLLATSIQAAMLVTRLLAPRQSPDAGPGDIHGNAFFGRKTFGFTDNLDTLNRWLGDMMDAERKQLARLRQDQSTTSAIERERLYQDGQLWNICRAIGHNLNSSLRISGCSSQRPGFNAASDFVIATSSLEVGFDDPEVGVMVHHKRPSAMASFVQRKGRAGRRKGMRPWTIVILSDYGADRYMFHNAERLFRPEIDSIFLPVRNQYVLRQQAAYFLIDWLGLQVRKGGPFAYLRPIRGAADAQRASLELLHGLLEQQAVWSRFQRDFDRLFSTIAVSTDPTSSATGVEPLLWSDPRPLLLEVVPTLIRKLETNWAQADPQESTQEDRTFTRPLPTFIPGATFGQLDLSELSLHFSGIPKDDEHIGIAQGLYEFCPGRVSKRYSTAEREAGYWLAGSPQLLQDGYESRRSVRVFFRDVLLLESIDDADAQVLVYQPLTGELLPQSTAVTERSNAHWNWDSRFRLMGIGSRLPILRSGVWADALRSAETHLHREQSGIDVLRFARTWDFQLLLTKPKGATKQGRWHLGSDENGESIEEAIGFRVKVDALHWTVSGQYLAALQDPVANEVERLRSDFFLHRLRNSAELAMKVDHFSAEWLHRTSLAMLVGTALLQRCTLAEAQQRLKEHRFAAAQKILRDILPTAGDDEHSPEAPAKLRDTILSLWRDPEVIVHVERLENSLWESLGPEFHLWTKQRFLSALSQAFRSAVLSPVQGVSEDDLALDVLWDGRGDAEIYLTEGSSGGLGHIEAVVAEMRRSPETIPEGVRHALAFCPRHENATSLLALLEAIIREPVDGPLHAVMAELRAATDFQHIAEAAETLKKVLWDVGLDSSRSFVVTLVGRFLRPGSTPTTDRLIYAVNRLWRKRAKRIGIPIDPSVWAYVCATYRPARRRFSEALRALSGGQEPTVGQIYRLVQQMLIEGCEDACPECLSDYNPYNTSEPGSRGLAARWFATTPPQVSLEHTPHWQQDIRELLCRHSTVDLSFNRDKASDVMAEVQKLLAEELEVESLLVPAMLAGIRRAGTRWVVSLQLRGMVA
jgi:hypothetical protein